MSANTPIEWMDRRREILDVAGQWVDFRFYPYEKTNQKTHVWHVMTKADRKIGEVRWWGAWRKYCFFPEPETLWDSNCLADVSSFLARQTHAQRKGVRARAAEKGK